ncbi:hypothetical protein GCM10008955_38580 [Deinococcus malanensis]|uniref:Manganese transport regulator n=1 Tax=Deinococcus malanensis TaxID=1706855 RepID=A0ABQ2F4V3_9DEIO|nr:metal-dependent transcriptional regulator [Deinococcus malanensis]GGK41034.1 hypothetical protein GCM10008955_38580 [Deinococcus malanensis]
MPRTERSSCVTPAQGEYLKRLLHLQTKTETRGVATGRLAQDLNVKDASVTGMLERLAQAGWVVYSPYRGARLTEEGCRIATTLVSTHSHLLTFLQQTLEYPPELAQAEAEHLEHHVSPEFMRRLETWVNSRMT